MCIMMTPDPPSGTLLVLTPLQEDGGVQRWQLIYVNSVLGFARPVLMVVPIPNNHGLGEQDFTLLAVEEGHVSRLRRSVDRLFESYEQKSTWGGGGLFGGGATFGGGAGELAVQQIGKYRISMAPSLHDLKTRAPWHRFSIEQTRIEAILMDMQKHYAHGFGFVVAEADGAVRDEGWSVVFRDRVPFFPTAHEVVVPPGMHAPALQQFDATLVAINTIIFPSSICTDAQIAPAMATCAATRQEQHVIYRVDDSTCHTLPSRWGAVSDLLRATPVRGSGAFHSQKLLRHARPIIACMWKLKGGFRNSNVVGRVAGAADAQALLDAYEQLDSWATLRAELGGPIALGMPLLNINDSAQNPTNDRARSRSPIRTQNGGLFGAPAPAFGSNCPLPSQRGVVVDFLLMLLGRQLAMPGISDRVPDVPSPEGQPANIPNHFEWFYNLDYGLRDGVQPDHSIDLDAAAFARKDSPDLCQLKNGIRLEGSVYFRLSALPARSELLDISARTVQSA